MKFAEVIIRLCYFSMNRDAFSYFVIYYRIYIGISKNSHGVIGSLDGWAFVLKISNILHRFRSQQCICNCSIALPGSLSNHQLCSL